MHWRSKRWRSGRCSPTVADQAEASAAGLRRSVGTGVTRPRCIRLVRMRPTVEVDTATPSLAEKLGIAVIRLA